MKKEMRWLILSALAALAMYLVIPGTAYLGPFHPSVGYSGPAKLNYYFFVPLLFGGIISGFVLCTIKEWQLATFFSGLFVYGVATVVLYYATETIWRIDEVIDATCPDTSLDKNVFFLPMIAPFALLSSRLKRKQVIAGAALALTLTLWYAIKVETETKLLLAFAVIPITAICLVKLGSIPWAADHAAKAAFGSRVVIAPLAFLAYYSYSERSVNYLLPWFILGIAGMLALSFYFRKQAMEMKAIQDENERREKETEHGISDWLTYEEFYDLNDDGKSYGPYIGEFISRTKGHAHYMTVATHGEGKGTTLIIPNLLIPNPASKVITDPKAELACITANAQQEYGQNVYIIDPWGLQKEVGAIHGIEPCYFNPFDMLKDDPDNLPDNCKKIAQFLVPERKSDDPYFDERARAVIRAFMLHIITSKPEAEHHFGTLYNMTGTSILDFPQLLETMEKNTAYDGIIKTAAGQLSTLLVSDKTFGSVMSSVHNATEIFSSPALRRALYRQGPDDKRKAFNPYCLTKKLSTLYICIPADYFESHAAFLKMILTSCFRCVNRRPGIPVNFFIDEAGLIGKYGEIGSAYSFGRGQGISVWTFWQTIAQIRDVVGEDMLNHYVGSANIFQAFGLRDDFSCKYVSDMCGNKTRVRYIPPTREGERGRPEAYDYPLIPPDEVRNEPDMIIFADGKKTKLKRIPYFSEQFPEAARKYAEPTPAQNRAKAAKMAEEDSSSSSSEQPAP